MMPLTKGEYRVGIAFNPSADSKVDLIKRMAADLIDLIETIEASNKQDGAQVTEVIRCKSLAQTAVEEGAMWAVKAATKQKREG